MFGSAAAAMRWAVAECARFRKYRQEHGEGLEDLWDRQRSAKDAERRRHERLSRKRTATYEMLSLFLSDLELVKEWLPTQALARMETARGIVAFVETDPPKKQTADATNEVRDGMLTI